MKIKIFPIVMASILPSLVWPVEASARQPMTPQQGAMGGICKQEIKYPRTGVPEQDKKLAEMEEKAKVDLAKKCAPGGMLAGGLPGGGGMAPGGSMTSPGGIAASAAANQASGYPVSGKGTIPRAYLEPDNVEITQFDELVDACKNGTTDMSATSCAAVAKQQKAELALKNCKRVTQEQNRIQKDLIAQGNADAGRSYNLMKAAGGGALHDLSTPATAEGESIRKGYRERIDQRLAAREESQKKIAAACKGAP